nr:MAG TPA: hypothetical protein [Caudoviricetes sp.]
MGTINTAEIAKKNPSVYIEMVQQKAELDSIALENAKQLSLLYLETYAKENNLSEEDKAYLESVIEYRVLMEEAKNNNGIFSKIINAFKRLWEWLFGSKDKEVKPEDLNKKVEAKFDLNDAERYFGAIQGDLQKLDGCKTKADVDKNKGDIVKTVNTLKTITTATSVASLTIGAVIGIKNKIKSANGAVTKMAEKAKQSYDEEIAKYKTDSGSSDDSGDNQSEKNKKIQELEEAQKEVAAQYQSVLDQLTTMSKEIKRLIDEGTSDSSSKSDKKDDDENEGTDEEKDDGPTDPDVQDMLKYGNGSGDSGKGSVGGNTPVTKWVNQFHYRYTKKDYDDGKVTISIGTIPDAFIKKEASKKVIYKLTDDGNKKSAISVSYKDITDIVKAFNANYVPGLLPNNHNGLQINALKKDLNKYGEKLTEYIIKGLYGDINSTDNVDLYHINSRRWSSITNSKIWNALSSFDRSKSDDFIKNLFEKKKKVYKNGLTEDENKAVKNIAEILSDESIDDAEFNAIKSNINSSTGNDIKDIVKKWLGISNKPSPVPYYKR